MDSAQLRQLIRDLPDYPAPGVTFRDITPLLADAGGFSAAIDALAEPFIGAVDVVAGVEARGFMFAAPVAHRLGVGFVPIRKPNKLPRATHCQSYELEYGTDVLEIHQDAISAGARCLLIDDVLATGGTAEAACSLIEKSGGDLVALSVLLELDVLGGRAKLGERTVHAVMNYRS
ncbi:MAG TPA: adenine phosphoribosyltransferase [Acidimicrobiaceae bacterium]|jgi:adenine phosphoribosyltransferase|nr:adenine phosphoribosyltransferase [Acidimicrobiaceae bacterium]